MAIECQECGELSAYPERHEGALHDYDRRDAMDYADYPYSDEDYGYDYGCRCGDDYDGDDNL